MEAHMEAVPSPVRLWWAKLGKWQASMVVATLAIFFVTLNITGDTKGAVVVVIATFAFAPVFTIVAISTFTGAFALFAIFAATFATATIAFFAAILSAFTTATVVVTFTIFATAAATFAEKVPGIGKKTVWLSYAGEFLLISLPMVWVLRG